MRGLLLSLALCFQAGLGLAQTDPVIAPQINPVEVEARTETISKTLRCVVCQNQSINDSNAPLAADMRNLVSKRILAGDSDAEVREYLRVRYGDYVLMRPPFQKNTWLLWLGPLLLLASTGLWFLLRASRSKQAGAIGRRVISEADRARVRAALGQMDDDEAGS